MTDILREIEEDVRRQQLEKIWQRYGTVLIGAAVVVVVAVAAFLGWQAYDRGAREAATRTLSDAVAIDPASGGAAAAALEPIIADAPGGVAALAKMRLAALKAAEDRAAAIALYDAVIAEAPDPLLADAARYRAALLAADIAPRADIEARLAPLRAPASTWRFLADELAAYAAFRAKDETAARAIYRSLADDLAAPSGVRERAGIMLTRLTPAPADPAAPDAPPAEEVPPSPPSDATP